VSLLLALGGTQTFIYSATGGIVFGGTANELRSRVVVSAGGIQFGGAAAAVRQQLKSATGGIVFAGSATEFANAVRVAAGGLQFGGTAQELRQAARTAAGGLQFAGTSEQVRHLVETVGGSLQFGGTADYSTSSGASMAIVTYPRAERGQFAGIFSQIWTVRNTGVDIANLIDAAGATQTFTVPGVALGDMVLGIGFGLDLQGITVTGWVSAANTVSLRFQNESGGAVDLAAMTVDFIVARPDSKFFVASLS
jgi:hypothetical protein